MWLFGRTRRPRACCLLVPVAVLLGAGLLASALALVDRFTSARIAGVPPVVQAHHLSCEYAAASAVTRFWGRVVSEDTFIRAIPHDPNPHRGYRGDIDGTWGGTDDYGIYAEPLVPVLERAGYQAAVFYGPQGRLQAEIRAGHPVVAWITGRPGLFARIALKAAGQRFTVTPYEHALVVYGYDRAGVAVMDVGTGQDRTFDWDDFLARWSYFDDMALVITPAS